MNYSAFVVQLLLVLVGCRGGVSCWWSCFYLRIQCRFGVQLYAAIEHVELQVLTSLPPCSFLQYGDNPYTVQFPSWRMSKLLTDWEPESTASQMGLENAFHHSLLHTFLLCHIRAPIMMSLSPGW